MHLCRVEAERRVAEARGSGVPLVVDMPSRSRVKSGSVCFNDHYPLDEQVDPSDPGDDNLHFNPQAEPAQYHAKDRLKAGLRAAVAVAKHG